MVDFIVQWLLLYACGLQSADGLNCEQIMNTSGTVTVLCIDNVYGLIVAAVKNTIK